MKITKELKHATFTYDEESKTFTVDSESTSLALNKIYAFAFMRFVIRISQRNWLRTKPPQEEKAVGYTGLTPQDIGPDWRTAQLNRLAAAMSPEGNEDSTLSNELADHPDQTEFTY